MLSHNSTSVNGSLNTNIFNHIPAVVKCCKDRIDIIFFSISSKYVNFSDEITLPTQKLRKSPEFRLRYLVFVLSINESEILELLFIEGLKPIEVSELLGCSLQHVYNRRSAAIKELRSALIEEDKK